MSDHPMTESVGWYHFVELTCTDLEVTLAARYEFFRLVLFERGVCFAARTVSLLHGLEVEITHSVIVSPSNTDTLREYHMHRLTGCGVLLR